MRDGRLEDDGGTSSAGGRSTAQRSRCARTASGAGRREPVMPTGASAAQFIYAAAHSTEWGAPPAVPQGWAVFAADPVLRRLCNADGASRHWSEFDRGGHFAAMETPDALTGDIRTFFRSSAVIAHSHGTRSC
jgi:hypothetical protein